ncbi:PhzF family phenazine biosynthesis protein [Afifella sp. IM 167]|uniref:PhzF family phenazine biosynthesis protein n=1 Tax=Afifella sp. IM 167 TaxID=2033586 RepID=UPI001CCB5F2C|nr:PhzF family phenazine biosynthesis protein [Afifella sp. IM 167]MBZ8135244.1 phenazine biosynthesis protein PhzF [Afifella sp. IM 167]
MQRRYRIYDVFTDKALAGNQLAVVLDAEGLSPAQMQAIGREFNLSETVFVLPADNPAHSARIRIFTPASELPFAGHPTVGAAICLAAERFGEPDGEQDAVVVLEEGIGPVRCGVKLWDHSGFAEFDCPKLPSEVGVAPELESIAAACGLTPGELLFENHRPTVWSAGLPYHFVPVSNRAALGAVEAIAPAWEETFSRDGVYFYCRDPEGHEHHFRARMLAPAAGIPEDPATGSAVAAFAGPILKFDQPTDGDHAILVEQGYEMERPALIRLDITVGRGALTNVRIGGGAVRVMEGTINA